MHKSNLKLILFQWFLLLISSIVLEAQNVVRPNITAPTATGMQVNSYTGNLYHYRQDLFIPARGMDLDFTFFYNSTQSDEDWGYGNGWSHAYNIQLLPKQDEPLINCGGVETPTEYLVFLNDEGAEIRFKRLYEGGECLRTVDFQSPPGFFGKLEEINDVGSEQFRLTMKDGMTYHFETAGSYKLTKIEDRNGNTISLAYNSAGANIYQLSSVTGPAGRKIDLQWQNGHLSAIVDALETETRSITYAYENGSNLSKVTNPMGGEVLYGYGESNLMTGMIDENGNSTAIVYQAGGTVETLASCLSRQKFNYNPEEGKSYVTDVSGSGNLVTTYEFDADGRNITRRGNCCGANQTYGYDGDNNIALTTDENGNGYSYEYDSQGNLTKIIDPLGNTIEMEYNTTLNLVTSFKDKRNNNTTYSYDENGNLLTTERPLGVTETHTYDANGNQTNYIDGEGNVIRYTYNANGYLEETRQPYGYVTRYEYDNRGNQLLEINANGDSTQYEYDLLNRLLKITDAMGYVTKYQYDARGNKVLEINAIGDSTAYKYDGLDRLVEVTNPLKLVTKYEYDNRDNLIKETDYRGNSTLYTYNQLNLVESQVDPLGNSIQYTYDPNGNRTSMTDENGNTTQYLFDALNRLSEVVDPLGGSTKYYYDAANNTIGVEDANGNSTSNEYDALNRFTATIDAMGFRTEMEYNNNVNLTKIIDAKNNATSYAYDSLGRKILETYADLTTREFQYDGVGNIIAHKDNNGNWTNYEYDRLNRLLKRDYPNDNDDIFEYDALGQMSHALNSNANVTFSYDAIGRVLKETLNGKVTQNIYKDKVGRRTLIYPSGRIIEKHYDARNQLTTIFEESDVIATFVYDPGKRLVTRTYGNGTSSHYSYDANNRILDLRYDPDGFVHFRYGYDPVGNKLYEEKLHHLGHSEEYKYDSNYQLINFKRGTANNSNITEPIAEKIYNYDELGNRTSVFNDGVETTYDSNEMNEYIAISDSLSKSLVYDDNGRITNDGSIEYAYNFRNQIINIIANEEVRYQYDALGRRIGIITDSNSIKFYFNGLNVIEEKKAINRIDFIYGSGLDDKILEIGSTSFFYHTNQLGSLAAISSQSGEILEYYNYSPYGEVAFYNENLDSILSSSIHIKDLFTQRTFESESNLYYFRERYYNPLLGVFYTRDPIGMLGGINNYSYVENNPINYTDPLGLKRVSNNPIGDYFYDKLNPLPYVRDFIVDRFTKLKEKDCQKSKNIEECTSCCSKVNLSKLTYDLGSLVLETGLLKYFCAFEAPPKIFCGLALIFYAVELADTSSNFLSSNDCIRKCYDPGRSCNTK